MLLKWLALRDSNPRLADYEPAVLTAELRAGEFRGHVGTGTWGHGSAARTRGLEGTRAGRRDTRGPETQRLGGSEKYLGWENGRQRGNRTHIARFVAEHSVR